MRGDIKRGRERKKMRGRLITSVCKSKRIEGGKANAKRKKGRGKRKLEQRKEGRKGKERGSEGGGSRRKRGRTGSRGVTCMRSDLV